MTPINNITTIVCVTFTFQISNLFARDEVDEICGELIPIMKKQYPRRPPTQENLYNYFLTRARHNLHVALCFSPVSCLFKLYLTCGLLVLIFDWPLEKYTVE